jgi:hypothetical protein
MKAGWFLRKVVICAVMIAALCGPSPRQVNAQEPGKAEGTWEGTMTMVHGAGLRDKDYPPQVWRMIVQGNAARMFIRGDQGRFTEIKPGIFKIAQHMSNALVYSIDSASDSSWIETEAWLFIQKDPNVLLAMFSGAVKNPTTNNPEILNYFAVRTGEFHRVQ